MNLFESIKKNTLREAEDKKFRISWGYNQNIHTGDYEDSGSFDIMAKDEEEATKMAYRELDRRRIPYDNFFVDNVSDATVFGIEYLGKYYRENGLASNSDPSTERVFVVGSEDEVKRFSRNLVGHFIKANTGAYKVIKIKDIYIAALSADNRPNVNDENIFDILAAGYKPIDLSHQKEIQEKILQDFKAQIKEEHYRGDVSFEMDDTKLAKSGYIGTICIRAWNFTNNDRETLDNICKSHNCKSERDRQYEDMSYYCFAIYETNMVNESESNVIYKTTETIDGAQVKFIIYDNKDNYYVSVIADYETQDEYCGEFSSEKAARDYIDKLITSGEEDDENLYYVNYINK